MTSHFTRGQIKYISSNQGCVDAAINPQTLPGSSPVECKLKMLIDKMGKKMYMQAISRHRIDPGCGHLGRSVFTNIIGKHKHSTLSLLVR